MSDLECPYCESEVQVPEDCHDQSDTYETECPSCNKYFQFTVEYWPTYSSKKADCLNGAEHDYHRSTRIPHIIRGQVSWRCTMCDDQQQREADQSDLDKHAQYCSATHDCPYCPLTCNYRKAEREQEVTA